jgi:1-phosphofructokinase family hexose kinase
MILCVAGSPSIDKLFEVSEIVVGEIHRPDRMIALPGGKGIHVAQVATALGAQAVVTGLLAGHTGRWVAQTLAAEGVAGEWAWGVGETRSSLSVADSATGRLTEFYEDGIPVSGEEWHAVRSIVDSLLPAADWLALAGSLPAGANGYSELIESAAAHGVRCAVDSRGHALAEAIDAGADLVKINIHEAAELLGAEFHGPSEAIRAARAIRERTGGDGHAVAVTLGEDGMVGVDFDGCGWRGTLSARGRYPVGCGDAFLAGILVGFEQAGSWDRGAALALGTAAANAEQPGAGRLDPARARELAAQAVVSAVSAGPR